MRSEKSDTRDMPGKLPRWFRPMLFALEAVLIFFAFAQFSTIAFWALGLADIPFRTMLSRSADILMALGLVGPGVMGVREAAGITVPHHGFKAAFLACLLAGVPLFIACRLL